ncbi:hypothetical protein N2152v2_007469 [Parachlorella kessleri]
MDHLAPIGAQPDQPVSFHQNAARADWVGSLLSIALLVATLLVMKREGQVVDPRANYLWAVAGPQIMMRWALGARRYEAQRNLIIFVIRFLAIHLESALHHEQGLFLPQTWPGFVCELLLGSRDSLRTLARWSSNNNVEGMMLHFFLEGLKDDVRAFVLTRRPGSFEQAVSEGEFYEDNFTNGTAVLPSVDSSFEVLLPTLCATTVASQVTAGETARRLSAVLLQLPGVVPLAAKVRRSAAPVPTAKLDAAPKFPTSCMKPGYNVVSQLEKTPALVSVTEALRASPAYRAQRVARKLQLLDRLEETSSTFVTASGAQEKPWGLLTGVPVTVEQSPTASSGGSPGHPAYMMELDGGRLTPTPPKGSKRTERASPGRPDDSCQAS